ncbi:hypothetical protein SAMN05216293_0914 [Flagellimonas taeanensis]|uniref:Uncharacterized protein n=1 Tax=Flagellimonas taeanensis TaxID=1005926 RepID=A0A1M6RXI2_9FLAO|nr:hypothetical protein SAMN05216293_0914 [Allomuricauda taeanensis]
MIFDIRMNVSLLKTVQNYFEDIQKTNGKVAFN